MTIILLPSVRRSFDIIKDSMFQNSYQNGTYFDLLDPKATADKLKQLYRTNNPNVNHKVFDKQLKTFVLQFLTPHAKLCLPRQQKKDLYLIQQYLIFQVHFFQGMAWNIELVISDLTKTKRRIILSPATTKTQIKPFFVKIPCHAVEGCWNNFAVDLYSFIQAFKGQTYRSLDAVYLTGHFKLRRIYTSASPPENMQENQSQEVKPVHFLPKNFYLPMGVPSHSQLVRYDGEALSQATYEPTQPSTKNSSFLKNKPKMPAVRTEKNIQEKNEHSVKKIKDFLSNTNGEMVGHRKQQKSESQSSQVIQQVPKTAKSTDKYGKKKKLIKTQQMPPKARSSIEKVSKQTEEKQKAKAKLNPWRSSLKEAGKTDASHLQITKNQSERNTDTPQTISMYKPQGYSNKFISTRNQKFQGVSEPYSDSQYVELSQKFSTLTDGKFLRRESGLEGVKYEQPQKQENEDEIEENIEMQTNSMVSSHRKEEVVVEQQQKIHQSICDSLQRFEQKREVGMGNSSLYGFGARLMRQFMGEVQRPYSPPIGERQATEQQVSARGGEQRQQVQLIYDPVLNCYYDHKTHTYYELKN